MIKPNEAVGDMTRIKGLARGYGEDAGDYGFYLHIWNSNSSQWEQLASHTSSSNQTISGTKTASLTNYVDGSGYIYLLVSSLACEYEGSLNVDYAECEITYLGDNYGAELYIRNFNSSEWELLSSHTNSSDTTISGTRTSSISNYLDGSNYVYLLAYQKYVTPTGKTGHIYSDYGECEISYTSGAGGENDTTYTYDADLKRIKKDVDGTVQKLMYDGANVVVEYDGNNTLLASYLTPRLDENLSMTRNSATYYYHSDALGSIRNITDSSEVAQNTYDYYAFGSVVGTPTENVTNDYRFTGRRWDSESSLYYYRARMYAPTYGRFIQRDAYFVDLIMAENELRIKIEQIRRLLPVYGDEAQRRTEQIRNLLPLYAYVNGNPVNFSDPLGRSLVEHIVCHALCEVACHLAGGNPLLCIPGCTALCILMYTPHAMASENKACGGSSGGAPPEEPYVGSPWGPRLYETEEELRDGLGPLQR
jgi:RHS repeat-associated protein